MFPFLFTLGLLKKIDVNTARGIELENMTRDAKSSFDAARERLEGGGREEERTGEDEERDAPPAVKQPRTTPTLAPWMEPPAAPAPAAGPLPYPKAHGRAGGRQSKFTYEQKQWIYTQHQIKFGRNATNTAPNTILREILTDGQALWAIQLPQDATVDNVREVLRPLFR